MSNTKGLKILHFNVRKKEAVIAPLLENDQVKDIDVLAIQEPVRNRANKTAYNPSSSRFYLAHCGDIEARTCLYINKRIDPDTWEARFKGRDFCSLRIQVKETPVWIHNVYNPSPVSLTSQDSPSTLPALAEALEEDGEHVAVGDFNLHHPLWNNTGRFTYHADSDRLLGLMEEHGMTLGLPEGTVTWRDRGSQSAIDLSFLTRGAYEALLGCEAEPDLSYGSDHIPVQIRLEWTWEEFVQRKRRAWKRAGLEETRKDIQAQTDILARILGRLPLDINENLDTYTQLLIKALREIADSTIPNAKPFEGSKPYWNAACERVTKASGKALTEYRRNRNANTEERLHQADQEKIRTIRRTRTLAYRESVHALSLRKTGVWKLARWGKEKQGAPKELPQFPAIKDGRGGKARDFEGKVRALRQVLFPPPPEADLDDIQGTDYPPTLAGLGAIDVNETRKAIFHPAADKAPGISGIPNRFLRALSDALLKAITRLFQACIDQGYHPRIFKEANTIILKKPKKPDYSEPKAYRPIALLDTVGKALESIISRRLSTLAEKHKLLPDQQMGARKGRSVETALETLTESVHTIWNQRHKKVASLLSLNVAGAFDNVSHERLLHNLKIKRILAELVN